MTRYLALLALLAACAPGGRTTFTMPGPRTGQFELTVWNQGLGELTVALADEQGAALGGNHRIMPGEHRAIPFAGERHYRVLYRIEGRTYVTAVMFLPSTENPCWGMVVSTAPNLDRINPLPMQCR